MYFMNYSGFSKREKDNMAELYLCLLTESPFAIGVRYSLSLLEANVQCKDKSVFQSYTSGSNQYWYRKWKCESVTTEHLRKLESLTFQCKISSLRLLDVMNTGMALTNYPKRPRASVMPSMTDSYTWSIEDPVTIKKMCAAPNVHGFSSPIFEMHGFKWFLNIYPNGSQTDRKGQVTVTLNLASIPKADMKVLVKQRIYFNNKYMECLAVHHAETNGFKGISHSNWYSTADLKEMKRFCFTVEIELYEDLGSGGNDIVQTNSVNATKSIQNEHADLAQFDWNWYRNELSMDRWSKNIDFYGLQWKLDLHLDGTILLHLLESADSPSIVCIRFIVSIKELGTRFITSGMFGENTLVKDCDTLRIYTDKLGQLEQLTMGLQMETVEIRS